MHNNTKDDSEGYDSPFWVVLLSIGMIRISCCCCRNVTLFSKTMDNLKDIKQPSNHPFLVLFVKLGWLVTSYKSRGYVAAVNHSEIPFFINKSFRGNFVQHFESFSINIRWEFGKNKEMFLRKDSRWANTTSRRRQSINNPNVLKRENLEMSGWSTVVVVVIPMLLFAPFNLLWN